MQGAAARLTEQKRFQRSFELSEGDVQLPKLFRQTFPQHWPAGGKTASQIPLLLDAWIVW